MKYFKITSKQPEMYEKIEGIRAIELYTEYLHSVNNLYFGNNDLKTAKTFRDWLETEI